MKHLFASFGRGFRRNRRALLRDETAATLVEFGMLAAPFFLIVGAIMQTSVVFLASQVLESAVNDASREIRTGQAQSSSVDAFRTNVCDRLFGLFPDCAGLHVRVAEITNFQSATVVPPVDTTCTDECEWTVPQGFAPGTGKSVMLVQVFYRYPVLLQWGPLGMANMPDGSRLLGTATVFQNEPYS